MIPLEVIDIYQQASVAFDRAEREKQSTDKSLDPFIQTINDLDLDIDFGEASGLDMEYFGVNGSYWAADFGNPKVGDELNVTYDNDETYTFKVIGRGLLTLDMETL